MPQAHLAADLGRVCLYRLGARDMVETDRAQFTVQRRCCDRKAAGEEEVPRAETIYLGHEEQLEREANTVCLFSRPSRT